MKNNSSNRANEKKPYNRFLGDPTPAKASGLAFSASECLQVLLSCTFMIFTTAAVSSGVLQKDYDKTDGYLYVSYLLPQLAFALTAIFYFGYIGKPFKQTVKENKCPPKYFLAAILLQAGLLSLSQLNTWFLEFLGRFGYQSEEIRVPSLNGFGFFGVLIVVAALPAVLEELVFRGILLNGLKSFGKTGAVLLCGALFALYHKNPAQTLYQFCCGAAFALVAIRSGSILPTTLSHFLNNAAVIVLTKFGVTDFSPPVVIAITVVSALCLVGSLAYLILGDKRKRISENEERQKTDLAPFEKRNAVGKEDEREKQECKRFFVAAATGIAVCAVVWFSVLASGM